MSRYILDGLMVRDTDNECSAIGFKFCSLQYICCSSLPLDMWCAGGSTETFFWVLPPPTIDSFANITIVSV